ncbi:hypothetical protein M1P56_11890 [Streptomyces sp. HU2014]|uniref:hypothetical protein n=1 Tax=Streptomyces sp. HU2014 TaxID=2939414 RepID=UPI00200C2F29|nr:hypothetical protein [Streptomyces sp. HU2014]UQI45002.1 hypothetical protein M1P56_11890 [Streptomyces sp. HU2014]
MKVLNSLGVLGASALLVLGAAGGMAPAASAAAAPAAHPAAAADYADYWATDVETGRTSTGSVPDGGSANDEVPPGGKGRLECRNGHFPTPSSFQIECHGPRWHVFADCTNGFRYFSPVFSGHFIVRITCPSPYRAVRGGAVDQS